MHGYRSVDFLIVPTPDADLGLVCPSCGEPGSQVQMQFLSRYHPLTFLGLLGGILPALLIASITRQNARVRVPHCSKCAEVKRLAAQVRIVAILAVVLWIALGCGLILVDHLGLGLAVMAHGAFSGIFVALVSTRLTGLRLVQVDGAWAILAGVSPLYFERAGIPELPAPAYLKQYQPDLLAPFMDE
ncbi:MAG: hypothetical protein KC776_31785 [Myxococcales bacterium]|nr:hypothetical protein [Myxococcales bacterium]